MTQSSNSAEEGGIVSRNRVIETLRPILRTAVVIERRFTAEQLAELSGVKTRAIRSYMAQDEGEAREPSLSSALSLAVVLGPAAVNSILSIIGYGGAKALDDADEPQPMQDVAKVMGSFNTFVQAAADGRIDHTERAPVKQASDVIIATLLPYSSHGEAA